MLHAYHCIFVPDGLALLQNGLDSLRLPPELRIRMIIGEAHLLHLAMCVFFARFGFWVTEWDRCVTQLPLLLSMAHIYIVDIEGIFSEALMCRELVKDEDCNQIWMCVLEDLDCVLEVLNQLGKIPPCIKALSGVCNLLCFKCG